jgi:hypothetical protein
MEDVTWSVPILFSLAHRNRTRNCKIINMSHGSCWPLQKGIKRHKFFRNSCFRVSELFFTPHLRAVNKTEMTSLVLLPYDE